MEQFERVKSKNFPKSMKYGPPYYLLHIRHTWHMQVWPFDQCWWLGLAEVLVKSI